MLTLSDKQIAAVSSAQEELATIGLTVSVIDSPGLSIIPSGSFSSLPCNIQDLLAQLRYIPPVATFHSVQVEP